METNLTLKRFKNSINSSSNF